MQLTPSIAMPVRSKAYSLAFKILASCVTLGSVAWMMLMYREGKLGSTESTGMAWFFGAAVLMAWTLWHILRSKTTLNAQVLHQSWIWDKQIALSDMGYAKLIRVRGLGWLIAPRLYVRTLAGKFSVFYAAEPEMIAAFEGLERQIAEFRGMHQS